jgi:hypothetical protein
MKTLCADTTVPNAVFANWLIYSIEVPTLMDNPVLGVDSTHHPTQPPHNSHLLGTKNGGL